MFYFHHPFGISTPSTVRTGNSNKTAAPKKKKSQSKYTTTTYVVTEIQKNSGGDDKDEQQQDVDRESREKTRNFVRSHDGLYPWPRDLWSHEYILPPLLQVIEQHGEWKFYGN